MLVYHTLDVIPLGSHMPPHMVVVERMMLKALGSQVQGLDHFPLPAFTFPPSSLSVWCGVKGAGCCPPPSPSLSRVSHACFPSPLFPFPSITGPYGKGIMAWLSALRRAFILSSSSSSCHLLISLLVWVRGCRLLPSSLFHLLSRFSLFWLS